MHTKKFIILTTQRTGSTWLVDMLNSHPEIITFSELFLENAWRDNPTWAGERHILMRKAYFRKNKGMLKRLRPFSSFKYLQYVYSLKDSANAIGFKLMYNQLWHFPEILLYLHFNRIYIVHLIRSNLLDVIVSKRAAFIRHSCHSFDKVAQVRVTLDTFNLVKILKWSDRKIGFAKRLFASSRLPYLEVEYEELRSKPSKLHDLLRFVGVNPQNHKLKTSLKKLNRGSHMEIIANYERVRRTLKHTKYYPLLDQR
ncbi:MAG: sulfotransferase [Thermodesulfobacteriota bacterium]|nr:sulfotransferase [Thermodesulfobacteriota bacterium]